MLFTALGGLISGVISPLVPEVVKIVKDRQDYTHEKEMLTLTHDLAMARLEKEQSAKLDDGYMQTLREDIAATRDQVLSIVENQFKPSGVKWIDALNALIRPVTSAGLMICFFVGILAFWFGFATPNDAFAASLSALFGEAFSAVLAFMFGYRSTIKQLKPSA